MGGDEMMWTIGQYLLISKIYYYFTYEQVIREIIIKQQRTMVRGIIPD
jgi:hypothetical protein